MFIGLFPLNTWGQQEQSLEEVIVRGVLPEHFMVGQKVTKVDSASLSQNSNKTLADFLQYQAPIAFRSYGVGQLSTISFRGTSANHTALLWNGININFPSLGLTDYSTIPINGFDQMSIQYGSAASVVGTDAIGGSLQLRSLPSFKTNKFGGFAAISVGTLKNFNGSVGFKVNTTLNKNWKLSSKTVIYGSANQNFFGNGPFRNKNGDLYPVEKSQNDQKGLVQDLFFQNKKGDLWCLNIWAADNQLATSPQLPSISEITRTKNFRNQLSLQKGSTLYRIAFIRDITDYQQGTNSTPSHTEIDKYLARVENDFNWGQNKNNLKIGAEIVHFNALVDGYGSIAKTENRADIYALFRRRMSKRLMTSINLRQAFVSKFNPPFSPSFGAEYQLLKNKKYELTWLGNIARSYRVPTLNERFWLQLGDPNLKPESGWSKETGLNLEQNITKNLQSTLTFTAFHNLIDNWVYWNPERNYRVENLQKVLTKGIELDWKITQNWEKANFTQQVIYAYTDASQQQEYGAYTQDIIGKQLIYIPKHTISGSSVFLWNKLSTALLYNFNSERHVTFDHSGTPFPPFFILNANISYPLKIHKTLAHITFQGNNLSNSIIPNIRKNAMPLRSFTLNFQINF